MHFPVILTIGTHQKTKTKIPYTISPKAARFNVLETVVSFRVNYITVNHLFLAIITRPPTSQKNRPGRMNDSVVDPVAPTNDKTRSEMNG